MAFYELRQYKVKKGKMKEWLKIMEEEIIPFQVSKGMVITAGLVFCPPAEHREPMSGLAIPFSMWQCAGHGDAAGPGFVR